VSLLEWAMLYAVGSGVVGFAGAVFGAFATRSYTGLIWCGLICAAFWPLIVVVAGGLRLYALYEDQMKGDPQ
jgi:hypothetical protein